MSDQNTADNWRLEESGDTLDQWKLQETEQTQIGQWQLEGSQYGEAAWQPVEYERQLPRRGSWLLPLLVGLALIAVFVYGVWIGLGTLGITDFTAVLSSFQTVPTPTLEVAVAQVPATPIAEATATTLPTATAVPTNTPEPSPSPTPAPLKVEQQIVRVTIDVGVNARREPSAEAELIEILPQNSEYLVTEARTDGWLQIALPSTELAWISSEFVESRSEQVLLEMANQRRTALNLPPLDASLAVTRTAEPVAAVPTATVMTATETLTGTQPVTGAQPATITQPIPTGVTPTLPITPSSSVAITGTVNITAGLNARSTPTTTGLPVALLGGGVVIPIVGRSADGEWLQTRLDDGTEAWVFAQYIDVSESVVVPIATPGVLPPLPSPPTPITITTPVTETADQPVPGGVSASVSSLSGANARLAPDRTATSFAVIPYDIVLTVQGRTANNEWLQVEYQGQTVWVLVSTVSLTTDLTLLPVVTPN